MATHLVAFTETNAEAVIVALASALGESPVQLWSVRGVPGVKVVAICESDDKKRAGDWTGVQGNFGPRGTMMDMTGMMELSGMMDPAWRGDLHIAIRTCKRQKMLHTKRDRRLFCFLARPVPAELQLARSFVPARMT